MPADPDPAPARAWRLADSVVRLTPDERDRRYERLNTCVLVAGVLARAGFADTARRVLLATKDDPEVDPSRELGQHGSVHLDPRRGYDRGAQPDQDLPRGQPRETARFPRRPELVVPRAVERPAVPGVGGRGAVSGRRPGGSNSGARRAARTTSVGRDASRPLDSVPRRCSQAGPLRRYSRAERRGARSVGQLSWADPQRHAYVRAQPDLKWSPRSRSSFSIPRLTRDPSQAASWELTSTMCCLWVRPDSQSSSSCGAARSSPISRLTPAGFCPRSSRMRFEASVTWSLRSPPSRGRSAGRRG